MTEEEKIACSKEADSFINWAAGRAAAIVLVPLPLADVLPLVANEVYMIHKLAKIYHMEITDEAATALIGCSGASLAGKLFSSILPGLGIAVAAGTTYGVGKMAKAYFESGKQLNTTALKEIYEKAKQEVKDKVWTPITEDKKDK